MSQSNFFKKFQKNSKINQNIKNHLKKPIFKNNESYTIIRHNKKLNNFATHSVTFAIPFLLVFAL